MNFKDIIAKHALAQGIDWRGPDHLEKDAGQIKMPNLNSKFTRPEQQVKRVSADDEHQKGKSFYSGSSPNGRHANDRVQPNGGELVIDQRKNHAGGENPAYAIMGQGASKATQNHEGFHFLSNQLQKKYGTEKIHNMYNGLLGDLHPKVHEVLHNILQQDPNYRRMSQHPDIKWKTAYQEEKINLLHDLVNKGKDKDGIDRRKILNNSPEADFHQMGFKGRNHFDNELKSNWKRLRDKANAVKPEDL